MRDVALALRRERNQERQHEEAFVAAGVNERGGESGSQVVLGPNDVGPHAVDIATEVGPGRARDTAADDGNWAFGTEVAQGPPPLDLDLLEESSDSGGQFAWFGSPSGRSDTTSTGAGDGNWAFGTEVAQGPPPLDLDLLEESSDSGGQFAWFGSPSGRSDTTSTGAGDGNWAFDLLEESSDSGGEFGWLQ